MKCKALTEAVIVFEYINNWHEGNVEQTLSNLAHDYDDLALLETVIGADRQSVRIEWQQYQYTLHIEHYSESVWLEPLDEQAQAKLSTLHTYLVNNGG